MDQPPRALLQQRLDAGLEGLFPTLSHDMRPACELDQGQRDLLIDYIGLLARWNRAFNLTAVRDPLDMVSRHLLDSLAVLPWLCDGPVLDAGTGAGLPGIPLAVARPDLEFTLLDSNGKKTRFVRQVVSELGLKHVNVVQARLESYRPARKFATIVARALAPVRELHLTSRHLCRQGGRLLALKGRAPLEEIAALDVDAALIAVHALSVPFLDGERNLIEIRCEPSPHG